MEKESKATIQNQHFKIDLTMGGIDVGSAARAIAAYLPGSDVTALEGGAKAVTDHLGRTWLVAPLEDEEEKERVTVSTPKLAYEDIDELMYLIGELQECGARGGDGCGMRLFACMEGQPIQVALNLRNIVTSKSVLLGKALQRPFEVQSERMRPDDEGFVEMFPCELASDLSLAEMKACIQLGCAISAQAVNQNRASAEVLRPENEKYAFRCWLLRLGLKGSEHKPMRMRFLKRLEGDASYKGGRKAS